MSTRANVILKDGKEKLYFYRHSDGYPSGTLPTLEKFISYTKDGKIRNNICQASGWLIIIGADEYKEYQIDYEDRKNIPFDKRKEFVNEKFGDLIPSTPNDWKVGAYEPTTGIHGDVEYVYVIDLKTLDIKVYDSGDFLDE